MRRILLCALTAALTVPVTADALEIHAHRGGTVSADGEPLTPENSMTAFRNAHAQGFVVELDAKLAGAYQRNPGDPPPPAGMEGPLPVVMHDATLDRTTTCAGQVRDIPWNQLLGDCKISMIGSGDNCNLTNATCRYANPATEPIPTLAEVLDWAKQSGARLNIEIKNVPTDSDFDNSGTFADIVVDTLDASGIDPAGGKVLLQSFWPLNLDRAEQSGWPTSLLTLGELNEGSPVFAALRGYEWVSPEWPLRRADEFVAGAHAAGRKVVPYTLNTASAVQAAVAAGVDAIISDRPELVAQTVAGG